MNYAGVRAVLALAVLLVATGCSKSPVGPDHTAAVASSPPSANANCLVGAYIDPNGVYCVQVPDGYKPPSSTRKQSPRSIDQFRTDEGRTFTVAYWRSSGPGGTFEQTKNALATGTDSGGYTPVTSAQFAGADGLYETFHNLARKTTLTRSVLHAGDKVITCEAEYHDDEPLTPADACKTLRGL